MYQMLMVSLFCLLVLSACNINDEVSNQSLVTDESSQQLDSQLSNSQPSSSQFESQSNAQQSARVAYIDPVTGELTSKPSDYQLKQLGVEKQAKIESQQQFPIEERLPSGAYKISVPQSLHSQLTATIDEGGKLKVQHQSSPLNSAEKAKTSQ